MRRLDHQEPSSVAQKSETHRATISKFSFPNSFWKTAPFRLSCSLIGQTRPMGVHPFCPLLELPVEETGLCIIFNSSWEKLFNILAALEASFELFWDFLKPVRFLLSSEFDCSKSAGEGTHALWVLAAVPHYSTSDLTDPDRSSQFPHPGET